jgi:hypothetical protein
MSTEAIVTSYERPPDEPAGGNHVFDHGFRRDFRLHVDDHEVPYIRLTLLDPDQAMTDFGLGGLVKEGGVWYAKDVKWASADVYRHAVRLREAIERNEPIYIAVLSNRFSFGPVPESELNYWAWFLANAMAVAGGYTSHGQSSRPLNPFGPSRK